MKQFILIILTALFSVNALGQNSGTELYKLNNIGYIEIPQSLELQSGIYKKNAEAYVTEMSKKLNYEISAQRIVFQQKGLNNNEQGSKNTYVRFIIETEIGRNGDYEKINSKVKPTINELNEISQISKEQLKYSFSQSNQKLIKWNNVTNETINGYNAIKLSYIRQLAEQPQVIVNIYKIQNYDRMYTITYSYRLNEENYWKSVLEKVIKSLITTNIK